MLLFLSCIDPSVIDHFLIELLLVHFDAVLVLSLVLHRQYPVGLVYRPGQVVKFVRLRHTDIKLMHCLAQCSIELIEALLHLRLVKFPQELSFLRLHGT